MKAKEVFPGVFSRHAEAYRERVMTPMRRRESRGRLLVLDLLAVRPGETVLDLACGPGTLTHPLAEAVGEVGLVVGTDLAEGMLRLALEDARPNVALARMDSEQLGFLDQVFDAAACGHGLQFCPDLGQALAEVRRVLRPRGRFSASFPAGATNRRARTVVDRVFSELPPAPEVTERNATLEILKDPESVRQAARQAGFRVADVRRVEETITYGSVEELVGRTFGWWELAWRLDSVAPAEQRRLAASATEQLRTSLGAGPIQLPGVSHVLFARA